LKSDLLHDNLIGHPGAMEKLALIKQKLESRAEALQETMSADDVAANMWANLWEIISEYPGDDISMITPTAKSTAPSTEMAPSPPPGELPSTAMTTSGLRAPPAIPSPNCVACAQRPARQD
jgi:hypothetical protein